MMYMYILLSLCLFSPEKERQRGKKEKLIWGSSDLSTLIYFISVQTNVREGPKWPF